MKLTAAEISSIGLTGLYVTEKCDGCGKVLNQTVHYTVSGREQVYCSAICRDTAFFGDRRQAEKQATPGKCVHCGGSLSGKNRGALYCDDACRKARARKIQVSRDASAAKIPDTEVIESLTYSGANRIPRPNGFGRSGRHGGPGGCQGVAARAELGASVGAQNMSAIGEGPARVRGCRYSAALRSASPPPWQQGHQLRCRRPQNSSTASTGHMKARRPYRRR
jgi:hypothetical protein